MGRWLSGLSSFPPRGQLQTVGLQIGLQIVADPPRDENAPSIDDVKEAVAKIMGRRATGICNIIAKLLKAGDEAMIHGLHAILTALWNSGPFSHEWKKLLVVTI